MSFLDKNYLIGSAAGRELYQEIHELPIVDPHNHGDPREILENRNWPDIWQVEGATDHYVWELMRRRRVPEQQITGDASNRAKWMALARIFPQLAGNPTYEWIHLDLSRRFGLDAVINADTAEEIWRATRVMLSEERFRPQALLELMGVDIMCTTDDPTLSLPFHEGLKESGALTTVFPTWRPDKLMNIDKPEWKSHVERVTSEAGESAASLSGLLAALAATHSYFREVGCVASDHGLTEPVSAFVSRSEAERIYLKAWQGKGLELDEVRSFKAFLLNQFGALAEDAGWVMQLHIGAVRDYRTHLFRTLGPDSGGDVSNQGIDLLGNLHYFLNEFDEKVQIVLYCLDPTHLPMVATLARAFPNLSIGAAWWFNDTPFGMEMQLKYVATVDLLANHAGMVTDSRKLMSFGSRTEMFRRILCQVLGEMVERGQMPEAPAADLAAALAYHRPYELFFGRNR